MGQSHKQYLVRSGWGILVATMLLATSWALPTKAQDNKVDPNTPTVEQEKNKNRHDRQLDPKIQPAKPGQTQPAQPGWNRRNPVDNQKQDNGKNRYQIPEQRKNPQDQQHNGWNRRNPQGDGQQQNQGNRRYRIPEKKTDPGDGQQNNPPQNRWGNPNNGDNGQSNTRRLPRVYQRPGIPEGEQNQVNPPARGNNRWDRPADQNNSGIKLPPAYRRPNTGEGDNTSQPKVKTMPPFERRKPSGEVRRPFPVEQVTPTPKNVLEKAHTQGWRTISKRIRDNNQTAALKGVRIPQDKLLVRRPDGTRDRAIVIDRSKNVTISRKYSPIQNRFGRPGHGFTFIPRPVSTYNQGYRDGFRDSRHFGSSYHNRRPVFMFFYSSWYFDDPFYVGFSHPGYHPNIYYYFGWMPRWCRAPSIVVLRSDPYPIYYGNYSGPAYYRRAPALDENGVDRAIADIRRSWLDADIDRFTYHLREGENVSIYFDTEYSYSINDQDYYSMTLDAMSTIDTISMEFDEPSWINQNEVYFTGRHVFNDPDGERQTVYVSYRLHRYNGHWYIIAVGSSPNPIDTPYRDFRYNNRY